MNYFKEKHEIAGTECRVEGCKNPVWLSTRRGLCYEHRSCFQRQSPDHTKGGLRGSMNIQCASCGIFFTVNGKSICRRKYCDKCRKIEAEKTTKENQRGVFRSGNHELIKEFARKKNQSIRKRYIARVLKLFIALDKNVNEKKESYYMDIIVMCRSGATLKEVGDKFGISRERVRQIERDYALKFEVVDGKEMKLSVVRK